MGRYRVMGAQRSGRGRRISESSRTARSRNPVSKKEEGGQEEEEEESKKRKRRTRRRKKEEKGRRKIQTIGRAQHTSPAKPEGTQRFLQNHQAGKQEVILFKRQCRYR